MNEVDEFYRGEILVSTVRNESGLEKRVYIKDSFVKDGVINMDTDGAQLAVKYDLGKVDRFTKSKIISIDEGEKLKEDIISLESQMSSWKEWKSKNPDVSKEEETRAFLEITGNPNLNEVRARKSEELNLAVRKLIAQKDSIEPEIIESLPELFRSIDSKDCFAITKPIMDRIYHLPELLKNAEAVNTSDEQWEIRSKLDNRKMGPIGLSHIFRAKDSKDAKIYLDEYRDWMRGEGLKVLTAYWKTACERKWFQFSTLLSEVMQQVSEEARAVPFSVKERLKFWSATRKLENTKLTIELHFSKVGRNKKQKLVIEHRLLDVGARLHDVDEDTYPNGIMVKVLNPNDFQQQSNIGTAIHNNTLKLHPKDVLLALSLQTRKAQTMGKDSNTFDEDFLIDRANLGKTAKSNKSKARSDIKKKLKKLEDRGIIGECLVSGVKQKKHTIKDRPKKR